MVAYFRWSNFYDVVFDILKFYCATVNFWDHKLTKSRKKIKTNWYFVFFLNFGLAKGGVSAPLALPLVAPLHIVDLVLKILFLYNT